MSTRRRLPLATVLTAAAFAALTDLASLGAQDIAMPGVGSAQVSQRR